MQFKTTKEDLLKGIQAVQNVITTKATLPILSHILLEIENNKLRLTATDLDIGLNCLIPITSGENGSITLPAKRFGDIVRELPSEEVSVVIKKNNLVLIETKVCQFKLMGLSSEEFPKLPEFKNKEVIRLNQDDFKQMLALTSFSVSLDESRYILNGVLFKIKNNLLTIVATDGRRLAMIEQKLPDVINKDIQIIIPIKAIHELSRNLEEEGELSCIIDTNQVLFELGKISVISRLIEGDFPDYQQVIPAVSANKLAIDRQLLLAAIKRAALLSTPDYQAVKFEIFKNKLVVSKSTPDIGESREELEINYSGKELMVGFNPNYLIDVLKNLQDATVEIEVTESEKPGVIRSNGYVYIVLPMRLA